MSDRATPPPPAARPVGEMTPRDPRRPFATSPFSRLARTHALGIAGDAMFAIGLAGSVFFSLDFNSARWRVALYLVLTIAPFAVAAPLIGPMIDRIKGGRRWIIVASMALRAVLCFLVVRHLSSLLFYPEAFLMLVLAKVYTISKSAVVPSTVRSDEELVEANSKLTVISAIAVVVAALPAGLLMKIGGPGWSLGLAAVVFAAATVFAFRLPPTSVAEQPVGEAEREELRSAGIVLASSAMGLARGIVGFLSFMLAFDFKNGGVPLWHLGVVAATAQIGFFVGAVAAPRVRRVASEEQILIANLAMIAVAGVITALLGGLLGAAVLSAVVGATSSAAKQAFDAIVQRDAPDANRGRSFARFETRFQLVWVIGALIPIIIPIQAEVGFFVIAAVAAFAVGSYSIGLWRIRHGHVPVKRQGLRRSIPSPESAEPPGSPESPRSQVATAIGTTAVGQGDRSDPTVVSPRSATDDTVMAPSNLPPPPRDPGSGTARRATGQQRRWARPTPTEWEPPPGFLSSRLDEAQAGETPTDRPWPRVFDDDAPEDGPEAAPASPAPDVHPSSQGSQLTLPLEGGADDGTATIVYPEPPWRDSNEHDGSAEPGS